MKSLIIIFFLSITLCYSQDLIVTTKKDTITSKVLEIGLENISYKQFHNQEGPTYNIGKDKVYLISFQNGLIDTITNIVSNEKRIVQFGAPYRDEFIRGQKDASEYYKNYKEASTVILVVSLLSPILGLVPAIITSGSPPLDYNLHYPNAELMKQTNYRSGYMTRAQKIKSNKVWKNWGIALGVNVAVYFLVVYDR